MTSWNGADYSNSLRLLVDCLEQIPSLRDPASRRLCLDLLVDHLGVTLVVDDLPTTRAHLFGIVQACRRQHPSALGALIKAVEYMEPGSIPVRQARDIVNDMTALPLVTEHERRELLTLLNGAPQDRLAELVRLAASPAAELPQGEQDLTTALAALERMNTRPDGVPPLHAFVEHITAHLDNRRAEQLRWWNNRQAERMGLSNKLLAMRVKQAAEPVPQKDILACLVIRIEPDLLEPELLTVVHWRHNDPIEWHPERGQLFTGDLAAVRTHVAELVTEAETGWAKDAVKIRVEFLLPYTLLNLPVDQWDLETGSALPRLLGLHYQTLIRSLDRARSPRWHREWRRRWELLKQMPSGQALAKDHWMWSAGAKRRQLTVLDAKLAVHTEVVSLILRSVPEADEPGEVMIGLRTGVPVMVWQRVDASRSIFEAEMRAMRDALPDLVEKLRLLRSRALQAARPILHVGSRVALLWDDPDRPVEPQDPPAAPNEEVAR